jgi:hypothetical protein
MSRKRFAFAVVLALAILALGVLALPTAAGAAAPVCPDGFMAVAAGEHHHEGDHDHEHHRHVGLWPNADLNARTCGSSLSASARRRLWSG